MVFQAKKNFEKTILKIKNNSNLTFDFFWVVNTSQGIYIIYVSVVKVCMENFFNFKA